MSTLALDPEQATDAVAEGAAVLVGDLDDPVVFVAAAASRIDGDRLAQVQELAGGRTVLGVSRSHARRLGLDPIGPGRAELGLELCAPVDASIGLRGGWSLRDRARTMRTAAALGSTHEDLSVPGHVHPATIDADSTPAAAGALELSRWAGRTAAVVLGTVSDRDGAPVTLAQARSVAALRRLPLVSSTELRGQAIAASCGGLTVECELPTSRGPFRAVALQEGGADASCLALVHGEPGARADPLVHVHVSCLLGDALHSQGCDCRSALDEATRAIAAAGAGVIVHVRPRRPVLAACARDAPVDLAPALALLRACGVDPAAAGLLRRPS